MVIIAVRKVGVVVINSDDYGRCRKKVVTVADVKRKVT